MKVNKTNSTAQAMQVETNLPATSAAYAVFIANAEQGNVDLEN